MWVKGSGGDLGTLTEAGLAVLRLDRLRALVDVYPGVEREDEMVAAFDYCLHGKGGAAPSIDTAMHGLVDAAHVDHLHPDAGIAFATAADGEALTKECFGDRVRLGAVAPARVPARARHRRRSSAANPQAIGVILGGHGITAWGDDQRRSARPTRWRSSGPRRRSSTPAARPSRSARSSPGTSRCPRRERRARAAALAPVIRGLASTDRPRSATSPTPTPCWTSWPGQSIRRWSRSAPPARTTSCAPRCGRWCSTCRPPRRWRT